MSAPARNSAGSPSRGRTTRSRSRSRRLTRASGSVGPSNQITPSQSSSSGSLRSARSSRRSAPRSSSAQWTIRTRPGGGGSSAGSATSAPGRISSYCPGRSAAGARPSPRCWRCAASIRPKKTSTSIRATWVERTRSTGSWKVATLSDCEWRSAAEPVLGANGSCTWTRSSGTAPSSRSSAPLTSSGIGAGRRRGPLGSGMLWPIASTRGFSPLSSASGSSAASRISRRLSRIAVRDSDGATIRTRWPRCASSSEVRATNSLISCREPQGCGLTCAIERDSAATAAAYGRETGPEGPASASVYQTFATWPSPWPSCPSSPSSPSPRARRAGARTWR